MERGALTHRFADGRPACLDPDLSRAALRPEGLAMT
jgi:hypothetical protein